MICLVAIEATRCEAGLDFATNKLVRILTSHDFISMIHHGAVVLVGYTCEIHLEIQ